jgi:hypothetical protein
MSFFGNIYRCKFEAGHQGPHMLDEEDPTLESLKEMHGICHEVFLR